MSFPKNLSGTSRKSSYKGYMKGLESDVVGGGDQYFDVADPGLSKWLLGQEQDQGDNAELDQPFACAAGPSDCLSGVVGPGYPKNDY